MASTKQRRAAQENVQKAQAGAKKQQTLKNLPAETRSLTCRLRASLR